VPRSIGGKFEKTKKSIALSRNCIWPGGCITLHSLLNRDSLTCIDWVGVGR
jgi:hypothetical protein